jgi:hypothetical protein
LVGWLGLKFQLMHACLEHYVDIVLRVDFQLIMIPNNTAKQGILQGKAEHLYTHKEDAMKDTNPEKRRRKWCRKKRFWTS